MRHPVLTARATALTLFFALPACFEVPPLPDSTPGCGGGAACNLDEICRDDGECAPDDIVSFDLHCVGVDGTVLGLVCGDHAKGVQCSPNGVSTVVDCPLGIPIKVCCGKERACLPAPPRTAVDRDIVLDVEPADGWNCTFGDEIGDAEICGHAGFSASSPVVSLVDCETASDDANTTDMEGPE